MSHLVPYPRIKSEVKQKMRWSIIIESGSHLEKVKELLKFTFKCITSRGIQDGLGFVSLERVT